MALLNIFLLLPDGEKAILKTFKDEHTLKQFTDDIAFMLSYIRKENNIKLYFDSENIKAFLDFCNLWNGDIYLTKADDKIRTLITTRSIDIKTKPLKDHACMYILWNFDKSPTVECNSTHMIAEIVERIFLYPENDYLLLNMKEGIDACRHVLLAFKDAKHIPDLPTSFARIPFVTSRNEFEWWLKTNHIKEFTLLDRVRFCKTKMEQQGKLVFKEVDTGFYWYLDNLHKDEYEIFNASGEHIGVANLTGEIDTTKTVKGRTIEI